MTRSATLSITKCGCCGRDSCPGESRGSAASIIAARCRSHKKKNIVPSKGSNALPPPGFFDSYQAAARTTAIHPSSRRTTPDRKNDPRPEVMAEIDGPAHYASADEPLLKDRAWIQLQWEVARTMSVQRRRASALLVLDEVQKIPGWPDTVKHLWDQDSATALPLRVLLLGSSPLLLHRGLAESLAGRFEIIPATHWSFAEMREGFGWDIEQYIFFGGYPGAVPLLKIGSGGRVTLWTLSLKPLFPGTFFS